MAKVKVPEKAVLSQIIHYLKLKKCLVYRMNTGASVSEYKGKKRLIRFGTQGMADVLAFTKDSTLWIEAKASTGGKQSEAQKNFQKDVESFGHIYILANSVDAVMDLFEGREY